MQVRVIYRVVADDVTCSSLRCQPTTIEGARPSARARFGERKKTVEVLVGESVCIVRKLQGLSQNQLATLTGIP